MKKISILILIILVTTTVEAFDNKDTHPIITEKAANININFQNYLIQKLGFDNGLRTIIPQNSNINIQDWLTIGSDEEDTLTSMCRASNHFLNPLKDWDQAFLTDQAWWQPIYCAAWRPIHSNVTWATGYLTQPGPTQSKETFTSNADYAPINWDTARNCYYSALTPSTTTDRETNLVDTFKYLGHVLHLLQDMAVPPHVRDDFTGSHFSFIGFNSLDPTQWVANLFEYYVKKNPASISLTPYYPSFTNTKLTDFWDTNQYSGSNPSGGANQGLAEYTNANFVSDSTIFKNFPYPPYPSKDTSVLKVDYDYPDPFNTGSNIKRQYYKKVADGETKGGAGYRLAGVDYLWHYRQFLAEPDRSNTEVAVLPPMDDNVNADYAQLLLPRAVGYSAALLDYFFRGTLNITAAPGDITFRSVKVTATNSTPNEDMATGEVSLVIRYKELAETGSGPAKILNNPSADYIYKVATLKDVDLSSPRELTFDFSAGPLPIYYNDMSMQLVFKGKLGNEDEAVAVSKPEAIDGVYTDFYLSLPPFGVYAKADDSSTSATFNELRVTALSTVPGGLSGGTISLELNYRTAVGDQFQSVQVNTEPANAMGYVFRTPVTNGVSTLSQGVPVELVFDLRSIQLPVAATDVKIYVVYTNADGTQRIGYRDISEPTPVEVFNNSDRVCINDQWYVSGSPEAIAAVGTDQFGEPNSDIFPHLIGDIFYKAGATGTVAYPLSATNNTLALASLNPGEVNRLGYILTDYSFDYAIDEQVLTLDPNDHWYFEYTNEIYPGTGFLNQKGKGFDSMYTIRGKKMWWGGSLIYDTNDIDGTQCTWESLP